MDRLRRALRLLQANGSGAQAGRCIPVRVAATSRWSRSGEGGPKMNRIVRGMLVVSVALLTVGCTFGARAFAEEEGENAPGLLPQVAAAKVSLEKGLAAAETAGKPLSA